MSGHIDRPLFGIGLTILTHNGVWDGVGTAAIGVLLVAVAMILAAEMKSLLIGESATRDQVDAIAKAILAGDEVERIIHMRTVHLGPEEVLIAVKTAVPPDASAEQVARGIDAVERRIRDAVPISCLIYIEPDIDRAPEGTPNQPHVPTKVGR